jgi:hypothetical protein
MKVAYSRNIGDNEVLIMCGYVGDNKCVVVVRDSEHNIIKDYGILPQEKAFEVYNKENDNDLLFVELLNFIDDLTIGSNDLSEDYIKFKAKRFLPLLKQLTKDIK